MKFAKCIARWLCVGVVSVAAVCPAVAQTANNQRPRLVVGLVVDQMRWDYLTRYADRYGEGGFKRLLREGYSCPQTFINYLPSVTAVGHASIFTGSVPAINGIAGNDFYTSPVGNRTYCTADSTVSSVGTTSAAGKMSPHNLDVTTVGDELRLATNFRSKVVGVAIKDRTAILPAGRSASGAYWMDSRAPRFISSTYYMERLPQWVEQYNRTLTRYDAYKAADWKWLQDKSAYVQSTPDGSRYEIAPNNQIQNSYLGNTVTLGMARAAIDGEKLGHGADTDMLTVSLSSTDYVGHRVGPNSTYIEDTYLRLDADLADFLTYLDRKIGKGRYLLFLTADHGAAHNPTFMADHKLSSGTWSGGRLHQQLDSLTQQMGISESVIKGVENFQIHLDYARLEREQLPAEGIRQAIIRFLQCQPEVLYALDVKQIPAYLPEGLRQMVANGYHVKRSGDIQLIMRSGWNEEYDVRYPGKGTNHGSWAPYDTHIPLIFYGTGVKPGIDYSRHYITDIAPTVAALLGIQMPNGCVGEAISLE